MIKKLINKSVRNTDIFKDLESENEDINSQITTLQSENKNLTSKVDYFIKSRKAIQTEISTIKFENNNLANKLKSEKEKLISLQIDKDLLEKKNKTLEMENKNFEILVNNLSTIKKNLLEDRNKFIEYTLTTDITELDTKVNPYSREYIKKRKIEYDANNNLFTLWISDDDELPELQQLSLKSMILTGHKVTLYTYNDLKHVPDEIEVADANRILDKSNIFRYKEGFNKGSYSGFANMFRVKCLYEKGTAWFDCDILAIKNINTIYYDGPIISSQYSYDGIIYPTNCFLRLNQGDKLLKELLDYMKNVDVNSIKHGETGPKLIKSKMDENHQDYYDYLVNPNFVSSINFFNYKDFLKSSQDLIPLLKFDEIWGFHMWNAMFRADGNEHETKNYGFYNDLKNIILTSKKQKEYEEKLQSIFKFNQT